MVKKENDIIANHERALKKIDELIEINRELKTEILRLKEERNKANAKRKKCANK